MRALGRRLSIFLAAFLIVLVGIAWFAKGRGCKTYLVQLVFPPHPRVLFTRPYDGQENVDPSAFIAADVRLPNVGHGIDGRTISPASVRLVEQDTGNAVPAIANTSGAGDAIVLQPTDNLAGHASYTFSVTPALTDTRGVGFQPFSMTFTTGDERSAPADFPGAFEHVPQAATAGQPIVGLTFGPDGCLYANTTEGLILRYPVSADGSLGAPTFIHAIREANGGPRLLTGFAFDPSSTADRLVAWANHTQSKFDGADDWQGKLSRLSGPNLEHYEDIVVNLPRSVRDHVTNRIHFGPADGLLYFAQGSTTAMGAPDPTWGNRDEHLLTAALLQLDIAKLPTRVPLDAKTIDAGGPYDPFAASAPLTIYASGIRNAFDFCFHRNGHVYAPANGSAAGGSTPGYDGKTCGGRRIDFATRGAYDGPPLAPLDHVAQTEADFLYDIARGGYYGHPNPARCEFVLDGGHPVADASGPDVFHALPVGTMPDRNYRGFIYNFGKNLSPDGVIEYRGNAFGGALDGCLLISRYSGGKDIVIVRLKPDGSVDKVIAGVPGLTRLVNPLAIAEDLHTGFVYVAEFGYLGEQGVQHVSLLRPMPPGPHIETVADRMAPAGGPLRLLFSGVASNSQLPNEAHLAMEAVAQLNVRKLTLRNSGTAPLIVCGENFAGTDAACFRVADGPVLPATIPPSRAATWHIAFTSSDAGVRRATLGIASNDATHPRVDLPLVGLAAAGLGGQGEPSLQRVLDAYDLRVNVGEPDPSQPLMPEPPATPNDELHLSGRFARAHDGPVGIEPLAAYSPGVQPAAVIVGYCPVAAGKLINAFRIDADQVQSLNPAAAGAVAWEPAAEPFSLCTTWPIFRNRVVCSEDARNTDVADDARAPRSRQHAMHFYPVKLPDGSAVPDAYVVAVEASTGPVDAQDFVGIVRNVRPVP